MAAIAEAEKMQAERGDARATCRPGQPCGMCERCQEERLEAEINAEEMRREREYEERIQREEDSRE